MVKIYPSSFPCLIILSAELGRRLLCNSPDALRFI